MSKRFRLFYLALGVVFFLLSCNQSVSPPVVTDFTLEPALQTLELSPGGETSIWVKLNRKEGFDTTVRMFLDNLPPGVNQHWSRDTDNGDCTLILSADEAVPAGKYEIELKGETQAKLSSQAGSAGTTTLILNLGQAGSFSALAQPTIFAVPKDSQSGMNIRVSPLGDGDSVSFALEGQPTGVSLTTSVAGPALFGKLFNAVLSASPQAPQGNHSFTIKVTSNGNVKTIPISLNLTATPANPTFKLLPSALSINVDLGGTTSLPVFISRIKGFNEDLNIAVNTEGTSLTGVSSPRFTTVSAGSFSATLNISAATNASPQGTPVVAKIRANPLSSGEQQRDLSITVNPPAGTLDKSFGTNGVTSQSNDVVSAIQADDKILVATLITGGAVIRRYKANGQLDTGFGTAGSQTFTSAFDQDTEEGEIDVAPDGKILLHVLFEDNANARLGFFRMNPNGSPDTSFSNDGVIFVGGLPQSGAAQSSVVIAPDGKIVIVHSTRSQAELIRLNADGSKDTGFGLDGIYTFDDKKLDFASDLVLQKDGKIVVVGSEGALDSDPVVARVASSGVLDTSFQGGFVKIPFGSLSEDFLYVTLDKSDRIIAVGDKDPAFGDEGDLIMARLNPNGSLDSSFDGDGKLTIDFDDHDFSEGVVVQSDNKILVSVSTPAVVVRLKGNGAFDSSFDLDGKVGISPDVGDFLDLFITSTNKVVAVGDKGLTRFFK